MEQENYVVDNKEKVKVLREKVGNDVPETVMEDLLLNEIPIINGQAIALNEMGKDARKIHTETGNRNDLRDAGNFIWKSILARKFIIDVKLKNRK
jgi:hypothetical protein